MDFVGWLGLAIGVCVPIPQLIKLFHKRGNSVSIGTYALLVGAMACYLIHAVQIKDLVFILAQSFNLVTNSIVLGILVRRKYGTA